MPETAREPRMDDERSSIVFTIAIGRSSFGTAGFTGKGFPCPGWSAVGLHAVRQSASLQVDRPDRRGRDHRREQNARADQSGGSHAQLLKSEIGREHSLRLKIGGLP